LLKNRKKIAAEFATLFLLALTLLELMFERFGKNSRNPSITPPQNQDKKSKSGDKKKKPGRQLRWIGRPCRHGDCTGKIPIVA
jgi:hypothetical protein